MGINAGIKVLRRITDEKRWQEFLRAVIQQFKDDPRVEMEVKIDLDASINVYSRTEIQRFHLTEPFNFVPGDSCLSYFWHIEYEDPFRYYRSDSNDRNDTELKEKTAMKLRNEVVRLNYTDVDLEELLKARFLNPAIAIEFHVGEHPSLPVYAHHFKEIDSKLTCGGLMADVALRGVYSLLQLFFPGQTQYWSEFREYSGFPRGDRVSRESQDETDAFYRTLLESSSS